MNECINMKKQDLKDIVNKIIATSLDVSFDDSDMSNEDKEYCETMFEKQRNIFLKKIKDNQYAEMDNVDHFVRYGISKISNELSQDWEDGCENECEECGTVIYPYDTECGYCQMELDTSHLLLSDFYKEGVCDE